MWRLPASLDIAAVANMSYLLRCTMFKKPIQSGYASFFFATTALQRNIEFLFIRCNSVIHRYGKVHLLLFKAVTYVT